jgi:hypothetical protein
MDRGRIFGSEVVLIFGSEVVLSGLWNLGGEFHEQ